MPGRRFVHARERGGEEVVMVQVVRTLALAAALSVQTGCYDFIEAVDDYGTTGTYGEVTYDAYDSWYPSGSDSYYEEDYYGGEWVEEDYWVDDELWLGDGEWYYDEYTDEWCYYDAYYDEWYCEDGY
jgi:hypothetical protein